MPPAPQSGLIYLPPYLPPAGVLCCAVLLSSSDGARTHLAGDFLVALYKEEVIEKMVETTGGSLCRYSSGHASTFLGPSSSVGIENNQLVFAVFVDMK